MPPKKPVVVEPAPSDILVPEVLHSIAKSMQRLFHIVFRSRPLVGQDPEANTDAVFTVAEAVDAEGYAWLRYADCSHDPAVKAGGQALLYAFPQLGATNEDELYDYFIVEPHVVAVPTRRCRSRPAENCESSAGGVSSASSVSSSEALMARCFALEEEINFLDPDRWHALLKGPNEKAVLEQQLAKRFHDMKHLSAEDRRAANDKLVGAELRPRVRPRPRRFCAQRRAREADPRCSPRARRTFPAQCRLLRRVLRSAPHHTRSP
eukprot:PhM_4_TR15966/c3_g1_i1/m.45710